MNKLLSIMRISLFWGVTLWMPSPAAASAPAAASMTNMELLGKQLKIGDVVFIKVKALPFRKVANATQSWTNHVGIVTDISGSEPVIAESAFPLSRATTWSSFVARSDQGRVAVGRLGIEINQQQTEYINKAAAKRFGIRYDTGFDLHSRGQFCSRFVREVLNEATGIELGQIETFSTLLAKNPQADLLFWKAWYFGYIPWEQETVTPASLLNDTKLHKVFDGHVSATHVLGGE